MDDKLAIVAVGGGARGRWQAGALKALTDMGWVSQASIFAGCSAGGLNLCTLMAGILAGRGADLLTEAWARIQRSTDVYSPELLASGWQLLNPLTSWAWLGAARNYFAGKSALDTTALQVLAKQLLGDRGAGDLAALDKVLQVTAFNYKSGQVERLSGKLLDMALSTSAIEGAFPAWNGYGDGGLLDNQPVDVALDLGATKLIVVYTGPDADPAEPNHSFTGFSNSIRALNRAITSHEEEVWRMCQARLQAGQVIHLYPSQDTGSVLDFSKTELFAQGVKDASLNMAAEAARLAWKV